MPITSSAKKALRASFKKRAFNLRRKSTMQQRMKAVERESSEGKKEAAAEAVRFAYKAIDKAVKRGLIKKNTAARKKSRMARLLK